MRVCDIFKLVSVSIKPDEPDNVSASCDINQTSFMYPDIIILIIINQGTHIYPEYPKYDVSALRVQTERFMADGKL